MHPTKLQGIIPPMITPLKGDDELDREGAVRLTEHLVAGGPTPFSCSARRAKPRA